VVCFFALSHEHLQTADIVTVRYRSSSVAKGRMGGEGISILPETVPLQYSIMSGNSHAKAVFDAVGPSRLR
jgi:hypothetical protein